jgi:hypothetical protein
MLLEQSGDAWELLATTSKKIGQNVWIDLRNTCMGYMGARDIT